MTGNIDGHSTSFAWVARALVLGGNRYIGYHLVFELARQGHDVTVMNSHPAPMPEGARRLHGDRRQPGVLRQVLEPHRDEFDIVYDNTAYQVEDLEPLVGLFRGRVRQFVFTSSVAVYRRSFIQPVKEQFARHAPDDPDPRKAYGVGKIRCEDYLAHLHETEGFPATSLRVTHTVGPRTPLATREPVFFARLEQGRPILVPGEGFPFVHLVHVQDVARLMVAVAGNERAVGERYNVGGAEITSILGCVRLMARAVGIEADIVHVPLDIARRAQPPLVHWGEGLVGGAMFSIDKALAHLHWEPGFGLEAAYRDSYDWFRTEGRDRFEFDFSGDDAVLADLISGR
ncbi:MAG: NAD-dependent epimerase/dehydratase family protein [Thermoleophilaceae bacterium]